jgi:beta propeller repeat protein
MYNLSTSTETQITVNNSTRENPAIYGDRIVWEDDRNGSGANIYMYNLSTSTETQITVNNSTRENPAMYGDRIVWANERNGNLLDITRTISPLTRKLKSPQVDLNITLLSTVTG